MRPSITRLADIAYRRRWWFLLTWLVLIAASAVFAPRLSEVARGGGFDLAGSESWRAADILQNQFGRGYRRSVQIIYRHPTLDVSNPKYREQVKQSLENVTAATGASSSLTWYDSGLPNMVSADGSTTYALLSYPGTEENIQPLIPQIREEAARGSELETHVIGGPAIDYDMERTSEADLIRAETYSLPLILIILLLVFGTAVAALLPLILGMASVSLTLALLYALGHLLPLSVFARNIVTMVGLGLGVDYCLFIVSRFREELAATDSVREALRSTLDTAGRAVVFSGAAVVIGLAMLTLFSFVFMRSLGIGGMLVAAISVLLAITLLPALLAIMGNKVNSARLIPAKYLLAGGGRFWHFWSRMVMRRPLIFLVVSMTILLALALPVRNMKAGAPGIDNLSSGSDSRIGVELFAEKWGVGEISPLYIVSSAEDANAVWRPEFREALTAIGKRLEEDPRVARVESIAELDLPAQLPRDSQELEAYIRDNPVTAAQAYSMVDFEGGSRTTMMRIITTTEPKDTQTKQLVRDLRNDILPQISFPAGTATLVGGGPAEAVDFTDMLVHSFPYLMGAVLVITYFVLLLLFRSVILPLKAIFMNLLSVSAAFGVLVLVFQDGWGESLLGFTSPGGIIPFVPVILFSVLFGLSMDYEVFLLSRMKEEYERSGNNEEAVAFGLEKTGRIITSAALIMIAVFGAFAFTDSIIIKEFGVGLAVSIFLDATIVRIILVPATMKLLGKWNWWMPAWLARILPNLGLKH
ncbi:MAG: MMPL family transporter [Thermoleophilia bacterium]|nr:MMPL family transporter [Thermoleophilia bacterium]